LLRPASATLTPPLHTADLAFSASQARAGARGNRVRRHSEHDTRCCRRAASARQLRFCCTRAALQQGTAAARCRCGAWQPAAPNSPFAISLWASLSSDVY
jgi:hypothetical protein